MKLVWDKIRPQGVFFYFNLKKKTFEKMQILSFVKIRSVS